MHLYAFAFMFVACSSPQAPVQADRTDTDKPAIERAVREFWSANRPGESIRGLAYHRFSDDIYLVGADFADGGNAVNAVARRFESAGQSVWKIEPYSSRWREMLRIEKP